MTIKDSDIKLRDQEYWAERMTAASRRNAKLGDMSEKDLAKLFRNTFNEMDQEVQAFYAKYGTVQASPTFKVLANGTKVMSGTAPKLVVTENAANVPLTKGTRLSKLSQQLNGLLFQMSKEQNEIMKTALGEVAPGMYYDTIYETYRGVGFGTSFNLITQQQIDALIRTQVNGLTFSTRVWNNRDKLATVVNETMQSGITQGISNREMAKRLADNMGSGLNVANRLIRTEVTNTYNQSALLGYQRSGIVKRYEYMATFDERTSPQCTALDGENFKIENAKQGLNFPPMHPNCRSTTGPYFGDSKQGLTRIARDLGGDTFTVPASMDAKNFKAIYVEGTLSRDKWNKGKRVKIGAKYLAYKGTADTWMDGWRYYIDLSHSARYFARKKICTKKVIVV